VVENRKSFDQYPIYLKHTLYHDDEHMKKARTLETSHRFFVYDKFKDYGNKNYNKGLYKDAVAYYERALSCFKWLEVKDEPEEEEKIEESVLKHRKVTGNKEENKENNEENKEDDEENEEENEENEEKDEENKTIDMDKAFPPITPEEREKIKAEQNEFKQKYKRFLTTYSDKNVVLHDGDEVKEASDLDMSKEILNRLIGIYYREIFAFDCLYELIVLLYAIGTFSISAKEHGGCF